MQLLLRTKNDYSLLSELETLLLKFNKIPEHVLIFENDPSASLIRRLCISKGISFEMVSDANSIEYCKEVYLD